jgi:hypothetical protein
LASLIVAIPSVVCWILFLWLDQSVFRFIGTIIPLALIPIWLMDAEFWSREDYDGGH